ncbi:MAG TPA: hypothetical protein VFS25_09730 [Chitinophaga sp.]|uniref:hypothetical protein n=1 Tax=Chitinophaga sp. TaxID=1869181 RepID=UPI002DB81F8B|nr:hypothetical protein [Chitinophaga sp.]HEU4553105.1 hypothetical protein [Chitinophaga sp.]
MTVKCYCSVVLLLLCGAVHAQTTVQSNELKGYNSVYFSLMGPGNFYSLHYDVRFQPNYLGVGVRIGVGSTLGYTESHYSGDESRNINNRHPAHLTIPFGLNYLFGKADRGGRLEVGVGFTYVDGDALWFDSRTTSSAWLACPSVAYRHYYFNNHLMWKVGFTPIVSLTEYGGYPVPWAEGSIGLAF